ncbi:U4/U6 small nuclear ribonucleoprotein Prp31 [Porphyridium purpureum]|uniref:U4/U6 small nuclear ribonucleoprotein Prp31 n=1 Tax=Porphyridium purpureum TaxID=35688 RepID=A0A5J4YXB1_PORPP|nr:U4/U6 small nuclear ribonucleoprotein Prp31 [Porphyridium purpureum]|eukprot:POR0606..scf209_3
MAEARECGTSASLADQFMQDIDSGSGSDGEAAGSGVGGLASKDDGPRTRDTASVDLHQDARSSGTWSGAYERPEELERRAHDLGTRVREALLTVRGTQAHAPRSTASDSRGSMSLLDLLSDCVALSALVQAQQQALRVELQEVYASCLPELLTFSFNPIELAHVVRVLANAPAERCRSGQKDLEQRLAPSVCVALSIAASSTAGDSLTQPQLKHCFELADGIERLDVTHAQVVSLVASTAEVLAPNCVALLASASLVASLLSLAGSLQQLACMPSCNVQVLGATKNALHGRASNQAPLHEGLIYKCDLVDSVPAEQRQKCARVVAAKLTLAARIDQGMRTGADASTSENEAALHGAFGARYRSDIEAKIEAWLAPLQMKRKKPLPVPDAGQVKKKHRGGRRARKYKEAMGMTEMRREANRIPFGGDGSSWYGLGTVDDDDDGEGGLGVLVSGSDSKNVRALRSNLATKNSVLKAANRRLNQSGVAPQKSATRQLDLLSSGEPHHAATFGGIQLRQTTPAPSGSVHTASDSSRNNVNGTYFPATFSWKVKHGTI